jgi:RecA/RadA recombinase
MGKVKVKSSSRNIYDKIEARLNSTKPKKPGKGTYTVGRSTVDSPTRVRYVVTTGIRAFDDRVGGMPVGHTVELIGLPQSAKTNMAVRTCVRAQTGHVYERIENSDGTYHLKKLDPDSYDVTVMYYDNEGSLSDMNRRRVDGTLMDGLIVPCDTVELLWKTMEDVVAMVDLEEEETERLQILIVVIDTVGIMSTAMDMEKDWGKMDYPRVPRQIKDGFKRMVGKMMRENVLLIGLNHVSKKMTMMPGRAPGFRAWDYQQPGGQAFSYCAHHQIYFEMMQVKYRLAKRGGADGYLIYCCSLKNRMGPPLREFRMSLLFSTTDPEGKLVREGGLNDLFSTLEAMIYDKAAEVKKDGGGIVFKFTQFGVPTTTFSKGESTPSLEEQDEQDDQPRKRGRGRSRDPKIAFRADWPAFYAEHQKDLDALYAEATHRAVSASDLDWKGADNEEGDEDEEED